MYVVMPCWPKVTQLCRKILNSVIPLPSRPSPHACYGCVLDNAGAKAFALLGDYQQGPWQLPLCRSEGSWKVCVPHIYQITPADYGCY